MEQRVTYFLFYDSSRRDINHRAIVKNLMYDWLPDDSALDTEKQLRGYILARSRLQTSLSNDDFDDNMQATSSFTTLVTCNKSG
jgi:hypothetical protein